MRFSETYIPIGGVWPGGAEAPSIAVHAGVLDWLHVLARAVRLARWHSRQGEWGSVQGGNWGTFVARPSLWLELLPGS